MKKNNTWNIRQLVNDSFGPSSQQTSVLPAYYIVDWRISIVLVQGLLEIRAKAIIFKLVLTL